MNPKTLLFFGVVRKSAVGFCSAHGFSFSFAVNLPVSSRAGQREMCLNRKHSSCPPKGERERERAVVMAAAASEWAANWQSTSGTRKGGREGAGRPAAAAGRARRIHSPETITVATAAANL